jgi:hypothetical protein
MAAAGEEENFHFVAAGPVAYNGEGDNPCAPGVQITGKADANGDPIGEGASLETTECAMADMENGVNHIDGRAVLTAADGAQIFIHYGGDAPLPNFETGDLGEDLTWSVTGGSDRFEGATGGGRLHTHGNFYGTVTAEFDGTVTFGPG